MNAPERKACRIIKNERIADDIFELVIAATDITEAATPGQFVNIYLPGGAMLLPRPISIAGVDRSTGEVSLIYAIVGDGTKVLSTLDPSTGANASIQSANFIDALGPLGTGFLDYSKEINIGKVILIGGGVGVPPLLFAAKRLRETLGSGIEIKAILGYRGSPWLEDRFSEICDDVSTISENPSAQNSHEPNISVSAHHAQKPQTQAGNVIDLLDLKRDEIIPKNKTLALSCGPKPMLAAVAAWCKLNEIDLRVSLEERMGCGYGACAGCTTKTRPLNNDEKPQAGPNKAGEDGIIKKKICVHGPVFWADEVVW